MYTNGPVRTKEELKKNQIRTKEELKNVCKIETERTAHKFAAHRRYEGEPDNIRRNGRKMAGIRCRRKEERRRNDGKTGDRYRDQKGLF